MECCPRCQSPEIHRTGFGSALGGLRRWFTHQRPHRCHECGWRGWGIETTHQSPALSRPPVTPPDLAALDAQTALLVTETTYYRVLADFYTALARLKLAVGGNLS